MAPSKSILLKLTPAVAASEFDFEHIKRLLTVALDCKSDNSLIWDQVYRAVTESTPPPQEKPWLHDTGILANSSETRKDMDRALELVLGTLYASVGHLRQGLSGLVTSFRAAFEAVFQKYLQGSSPLPMNIRDTLLDLDLSFDDCYYRLRREDKDGKRVIYVHLTDLSILPEDSRTSNNELIRDLSKLSGWYGKWDTLTVSTLGSGVRCLQNQFKTHALPTELVVRGYPLFDILSLHVVSRKSYRVKYVDNGSQLCYLKIARFAFEVKWLQRELEAIHRLAERNPKLGPELLGYAFEGSQHRVIGFLTKEIPGRPACISDKEDCEEALRELHASGVVHGDLVKHNILITSQGSKFIDFEFSSLQPSDDPERWDALKEQEFCSLEAALIDSSGRGRPWDS